VDHPKRKDELNPDPKGVATFARRERAARLEHRSVS
jgi:hypothetical protein